METAHLQDYHLYNNLYNDTNIPFINLTLLYYYATLFGLLDYFYTPRLKNYRLFLSNNLICARAPFSSNIYFAKL